MNFEDVWEKKFDGRGGIESSYGLNAQISVKRDQSGKTRLMYKSHVENFEWHGDAARLADAASDRGKKKSALGSPKQSAALCEHVPAIIIIYCTFQSVTATTVAAAAADFSLLSSFPCSVYTFDQAFSLSPWVSLIF